MKKSITSVLAGVALAACTSVSLAGGHANWMLSADDSTVAFGSVKADVVGEVHHFSSMSGSISEAGVVSVEIDVASVETNIGIRNERMREFVFTNGPKAMLDAQVDMAALKALGVGDTTLVDVAGSVTINGTALDINATFFAAMLAEDTLLVTTADMIMLPIEPAGLTAGVDKLMELAGLPSITRVSPVTLRMVFNLQS
ncbi:MAG: YceI family protein [Pseudomonadota bacterium]